MFEYWTRHGEITSGRWVCKPDGGSGRLRLYARDEIERLAQMIRERRQRRATGELPEGYVGRDAAAKMFGISPLTWKLWVRQRKVPAGKIISDLRGGRRSVYTLEELHRIREAMQTPDPSRPYRDPERPGAYVLPEGLVRREEAWEMFGVSKPTWERWERQGLMNCGEILSLAGGGRLKLYPLAELKRLLGALGRFAPPYPDPDRPGCVRVPMMGRGMKRREAIIDAADLALVEAGTCSCAGGGGESGCADVHVSFHTPGGGSVPLRRLIMGAAGPEQQVGHLNDDPLDCRRENLVVRTVAQRSYTTRKRKMVAGRPMTSRFKGVCWEWRTKSWRAGISCNGVARKLGRFRDEIAAAQAYDEAARELFGEHAWLNFPDGADARLANEAASREADSRAAA
jgi:transposase